MVPPDSTSGWHNQNCHHVLSYILWTTIWSSRNRNTDSCLWGLYFRYEIVQRGGSGSNGRLHEATPVVKPC
jgi:hypothetical protein